MKKGKLLLAFILVSTLLIFTPIQSMATNDATLSDSLSTIRQKVDVPPADEISDNPDYSDSSNGQLFESYSTRSSEIIGFSSITRGPSKVGIYGNTTIDETHPVSVTLILQRYYGGSWQNVSVHIKTTNGTFVSLNKVINVTPGYYYRVYSRHTKGITTIDKQTSAIFVYPF